MLSHDVGTWLRIGVVFLLAATICLVFAVIRMHLRAWRCTPGRAGLTPLHVALVSAGVLVWGVALAWAVLAGMRQGVTTYTALRLGLYALGAALIQGSLLVMARVQRRRVRFCRAESEAVITVTTTEQLDVIAEPEDLAVAEQRCPYRHPEEK